MPASDVLKSFDRRSNAEVDEGITESIAMGTVGNDYSIHNFTEMSDDEEAADDKEFDILLDMKYSMHEKLARKHSIIF